MSKTLTGTYVLAARKFAPSGPMTAAHALALVERGLDNLHGDYAEDRDLERQLRNIAGSVECSGLDTIPDEAARVLVGAVEEACGEAFDVLGEFNLQTERDKMNALKIVTISIAEALLKGGQQAIDAARAYANLNNLPGGAARDKVWWSLRWYADDVAKAKKAAKSPNELYASGADLKERVLQAFIEFNAAEEGAAALDAMWSAMWSEIGQKLAAIPKAVYDKAAAAAGEVAWYARAGVWLGAGIAALLAGGLAVGLSRGHRYGR